MKNSTIINLLNLSGVIVFIYLIIASNFGLPPASYFIAFYCEIFDTNKYPPMMIAALLTLVYALLLLIIKKKLGKKKSN